LLPPEPADPIAVAEGARLQASALVAARDRHAASGVRAFLVRPDSISGHIWFDSLARALRHTGVPCVVADDPARDWASAWRDLQPTLLVAPDHLPTLARLDLDRLQAWSHAGGRRLLVHMAPEGFPDSGRPGRDDRVRQQAAILGETADAFTSLYEPEYFPAYASALARAGFRYLSLPQALDAWQDVPQDVPRTHAWFMASTATPDRLRVAAATLLPVLESARGLWVGTGWRFGEPRVAPAALPALFGSARVALAPLVPFLRDRPLEITYRVFAAAACGAFQVTHRTPVTSRFFADDELVQAADDREFVAVYKQYLPDRAAREAVARRALARAWRDHTTLARADRLVAFVRDLPRWTPRT
jgi:hypothetical protein